MIDRRSLLSTVVGAGIVATAGCSLLEEDIEKEASPARVSEQALSETGYEHLQTTDTRLEQTVEVADQQRDLSLTNWLTEYQKIGTDEERTAANFMIFSSPTVSVAGRSANPFERFDEKRLISELFGRSESDDADQLEEVGSRTVDVLGESVEFTVYHGSQEIAGETVTVELHFGTLTNEGDLVAILGTHPELLDESENIYGLAEAIVHPTDP